MIDVQTKYQILTDSRTLAYCVYGNPLGVPVFYAHGGPGSRIEAAIFHDTAQKFGFRLISTDRPGMGQSTFKPKRRLLDYPADISELADNLGIEKFGVMGWSGGGAHTIVCGYALANRLLFNISMCGYTNFAELPGAAKMLNLKADQLSVSLSCRYPRLFKLIFDVMALTIRYFPEAYYKEIVKSVNGSDKTIASDPDFKAHFIADQKEAMIRGGKGVAVDAAVHYVDWGFRLQEIPVKVHVFHGIEDTLVPVAFANHLAARIPNCELHLLENKGHLFPVDHQDLIFETAQMELGNSMVGHKFNK
jgi:pimeloyl-ACP methyl ester carboxylesterase